MTIQGLINKIFRANQTQNNTVSWSGVNGLKSIQEDIVDTIRQRTFFTVPTTADLVNQGFNNAVLCYVQDHAFFRWEANGVPNGTTIFPANDGGVWKQETLGDTDGTVTSIGLSMPAAFTVANSPVTTNGVINVTGAGTSSQYIKGDGTLGTLPTPTGGTVTNVSALSIDSLGTDLSSTVSNPTTTPVITLSVPTASAVNRGVLSPADWTTFNSKQNAITLTTTGTSGAATLVGSTLNIPQYQSVLTNPVTGTGTADYLPKWTSSSAIGNSLIYDNGTNIGIGTNSPNTYLTSTQGLVVYSVGVPSLALATSPANTWTNYLVTNQYRLYHSTNGVLMTVVSNGNVLIGTTTDSGYKLDVNGTARFSGNTTIGGNVLTLNNTAAHYVTFTSSSTALDIQTFNSTPIRLNNSGGGGIQAVTSFTASAGIYVGSGTTDGMVITGTSAATGKTIQSYGGHPLIINSLGNNVLIGTTTNAGYKLDVNGTQRVQYGTVERGAIFTHSNGTTAEIVIGNGSAAGVGVVEIQRNGTSAISMRSNAVLFNTSRLATPSTFFVTGPYGGSNIGTSVRLASNTVDQGVYTATSGTQNTVVIGNSGNEIWQPSSGNATYNLFSVLPSINTSGTYAGIVRGFYYSPTLTSIIGVTHRAIETVTGDVYLASTSGNVGIGTAPTSTYKLDVGGTGRFQGNLTVTKGASNYFTFDANTNTNDLFIQFFKAGAFETRMYTKNNYSVGALTIQSGLSVTNSAGDLSGFSAGQIGVNFGVLAITNTGGDAQTHIVSPSGYSNYISFRENGVSDRGILGYQNGTSYMQVRTNGATNMSNGTFSTAFFSSGNVGIGTTTDAGYKLDVNGTARVTGAITTGITGTAGILNLNRSSDGANVGFVKVEASGAGIQIGSGVNMFFSNNGRIVVNSTTTDASAIFKIDSSTQGVLLPRMTDTQILAIASPANGLMVYSTTQNVIAFYDGTGWHKVTHTNL